MGNSLRVLKYEQLRLNFLTDWLIKTKSWESCSKNRKLRFSIETAYHPSSSYSLFHTWQLEWNPPCTWDNQLFWDLSKTLMCDAVAGERQVIFIATCKWIMEHEILLEFITELGLTSENFICLLGEKSLSIHGPLTIIPRIVSGEWN